MFDSEGERLLARRLQANLRNAEELKKQIAEKQRPLKSPAPYSTTTGDGYAIRKPSHSIPSHTYEGYNPNDLKKRAPFAVESPSRILRPPSKGGPSKAPRMQRMSVSGEIPRVLQVPELPTVSIPISNFSNFENSLPIRPSLSKSFDVDEFPQRLKTVESISKEQEKSLKKLSENIKRLTPGKFEKRAASLKESIDEVMISVRVQTNSFSESIVLSEKMLKKASESVRSLWQSSTEKNIELSGKIQSYDSKIKDCDFGIERLATESQRMQNQISELVLKLGKSEDRELLIHSAIDHLTESCANAEVNSSANLDTLKQISTTAISDFTKNTRVQLDQLREEIEQTKMSMISGVNTVNNRAVATFREFEIVVREMLETMKETTNEFQTSMTDIIEQTQNSNESAVSEISERLDKVIQETESNFGALTQETTATIEEMRKQIDENNTKLADIIETETGTWTDDYHAVINKYEGFKFLILQECDIQFAHLQTILNGVTNLGVEFVDKSFADSKPLLSLGKDIDKLEAKMEIAESILEDLNREVPRQIDRIAGELDEIQEKVEDLREYVVGEYEKIDDRLAEYSALPKNPDDYATMNEVYSLEHLHGVGQEEKVELIERVLDNARAVIKAQRKRLGIEGEEPMENVPPVSISAMESDSDSYGY